MGEDSPEPQEATLAARNALVLNEWPGIFPVAEADSLMVGPTYRLFYKRVVPGGRFPNLPPRSRTMPKIMRPVIVMTLMEL